MNIVNPHRMEIGDRVYICGHGTISAILEHFGNKFSSRIIIEDDVYIGKYCHITSAESIIIGAGCCLANNVHITDCSHSFESRNLPVLKQPLQNIRPTEIGAQTFLGQNVNVLPGVSIGRGCVIGANAVVTSNVPDYSVAIGVPARVVRKLEDRS
jgi:acetyltransferase-like isoleucine patch superfamily enzyme